MGPYILNNRFDITTGKHAVTDYSTCGCTVQGNIIEMGSTRSFAVYENAGRIVVVNNTIISDVASSIGVWLQSTATPGVILNNYIDAPNPIFDSFTNTYKDFNSYSANAENHGINSDTFPPDFFDDSNNDFRLKPNSPLLNTGLWAIGNSTVIDRGFSSIGAWQRKSLLRKPIQ